jgi:O-antigen ligase
MSTKQGINRLPYAAIGKPESLVMTDYWYLFGMWVVVFWAIDPLGLKIDFIPVVKQFPVLVIAPAFVLAAFGQLLFDKGVSGVSVVAENRKLKIFVVLFSALVTIGSLIARFLNNIDNNFLTMGLYALTAPLTAWFINRSQSPATLVKKIVLIYVFWSLVSVVLQSINFGEREIDHAREHLVIAALIYFYLVANNSIGAISALILVIFSALLARKNTAYLTLLLVLTFVFFSWTIQRRQQIKDRMQKTMLWVRIFILGLCGLVISALAYLYRDGTSPTGNPEYRLHTYELAWDKFVLSPLWGTGFTGSATEKFEKYTVAVSTQILPTHSDPLDILAHGGIIGFVLWVTIFIMLFRRWYLLIEYPVRQFDSSLLPYLHTIFCMIFSGILVCMFNPILNSPNLAWSFWALVGALLAVLQSAVKSDTTSSV